jgi:transposase
MSEGGRLTNEGRSFFFSPVRCQYPRYETRFIEEVKIIPFPLSESQLPGFLTTGRLDFTSGFNFGEVTSSRDSNRSPSGLLSRF